MESMVEKPLALLCPALKLNPWCNTYFTLLLNVCVCVHSRGQAGEGERGEHSGENLLSSDHTHPKQVGECFNIYKSYLMFTSGPSLFCSYILIFFCSENILELSIMPKDEDVLQLVSVSIIFLLFFLSFFSPCYCVKPQQLAKLLM